MMISGALTTTTLSKPVELQRTYQPQQSATAQSAKPSLTRRFDSVTISGETMPFSALRARSQLENEVRTATSSGAVSALHEEVEEGTYQPDCMEIARKMLLFGEGF